MANNAFVHSVLERIPNMWLLWKIVIFITLLILPPFLIQFIFFWPSSNITATLGVYFLSLASWSAFLLVFSRIIGFDLQNLFQFSAPRKGNYRYSRQTEDDEDGTEPALPYTLFDDPIALGQLTLVKNDEYLYLPKTLSLPDLKEIRIGRRRKDSDLVVNHKNISRSHAVIIHKPDGFYIRDKGSSLGTYVNDQRLSDDSEQTLTDRDIIKLGVVEYRFELPESPS